jgi:hypothetical protein
MVTSPVWFGKKSHIAGEGQQQFSSQKASSKNMYVRKSEGKTKLLTRPLVEVESPYQNTLMFGK